MEANNQLVIISFFEFKGLKNKFWAFKTVGEMRRKLNDFSPSTFTKILGSGGKNGFNLWPNWGIYCVLAVFNSKKEAYFFLETNKNFLKFRSKSTENKTFLLIPLQSHGLWDNLNPFTPIKQKPEGKIAVITRGRIKTSKLLAFWKFVPKASENLKQQDGLLYSIGIGELPVIQQATFSIWENTEKMMNYAYKSKQHTQVIEKTRELGWYSEELFARFVVLKELKMDSIV